MKEWAMLNSAAGSSLPRGTVSSYAIPPRVLTYYDPANVEVDNVYRTSDGREAKAVLIDRAGDMLKCDVYMDSGMHRRVYYLSTGKRRLSTPPGDLIVAASPYTPITYDHSYGYNSTPACIKHVPADTGMRWSYCKVCNKDLALIDNVWIEAKQRG